MNIYNKTKQHLLQLIRLSTTVIDLMHGIDRTTNTNYRNVLFKYQNVFTTYKHTLHVTTL